MAKHVKRENGTGTIKTRRYAHRTEYVALAPAEYVYVDGKRVAKRPKIGSFKTRQEAKAALLEFIKSPNVKKTYSLEDVYREWSSSAFLDLGSSTITNWTSCWSKVRTYMNGSLANKLMNDITTQDIRKMLEYYAFERHEVNLSGELEVVKPLSKSYITKMKALLTQLFDFALANKITDQNYASLAKIPKMEAGTIPPFTNEQFEILEAGWQNAPGGDACYVLCYTGFRVTEFCMLTKESYDPKTKILCGGIKTEAGKNRLVPVHRKILPIIEKWYAQATPGSPLYPHPSGKAHTKDTFAKSVWRPCMASLKLPSTLTPHSARHTLATRMAAAGARPEDIQKILGHADYSVTANTYIDQDPITLVNAMERID